jgi:hypothetical protein
MIVNWSYPSLAWALRLAQLAHNRVDVTAPEFRRLHVEPSRSDEAIAHGHDGDIAHREARSVTVGFSRELTGVLRIDCFSELLQDQSHTPDAIPRISLEKIHRRPRRALK